MVHQSPYGKVLPEIPRRRFSREVARYAGRVLVLAVLTGCDDDRSEIKCLQVGDQLPTFVAYLTWKDYDGYDYDSPSGEEVPPGKAKALYIWNGEDVGRGQQGIRNLAAKVRGLPKRSRVLVYPSYYLDWQSYGSRTPPEPPYMRVPEYGTLKEALDARSIILLQSPYNHWGRLCPECIDPHERPSTSGPKIATSLPRSRPE